MSLFLPLLLLLPGVLSLYAFVAFLFGRTMTTPLFRITEMLCMLCMPILFLATLDLGHNNSCCGDTAFFSPDHRSTAYTLIILCTASYFICSFRARTAPPFIEVLLNSLLLIGIVFNVIMCFHEPEGLWVIGNVPIILLLIMRLVRNHWQFIAGHRQWIARNAIERLCLSIMRAKVLAKFPLLVVVCLPVLLFVTGS